jgi:hypothetical protein
MMTVRTVWAPFIGVPPGRESPGGQRAPDLGRQLRVPRAGQP